MKRLTTEEFIKKAKEVHEDTYDYSKVVYKNTRTKVKITCKEHGEWKQSPQDHIQGRGCPSCGNMRCYEANKHKLVKKGYNTSIFISKSNKVHNNKYDYTNVKYKNSRTKVTIKCPIHGEWGVTPAAHLSGKGCPHCKSSKGEETIAKYLEKYNIKYERQKKFTTCKNKKKLPFDFFLPNSKILIEYQGQQHFTGWGNDTSSLTLIQKRDLIKNQWASNNGYNLLYINYNEDIESRLEKLLYENNMLTQAESSAR